MSLDATLAAGRTDIQTVLDDLLAPFDGPVGDAMRHATQGGKRLRGVLALECAALSGAPRDGALRLAAAIEAVHAYSLIHDDLPCMDDDDLRRGRPTVHRQWDEATAVLAGDALQTAAFEWLADPATDPDGALRADLVLTLARAAGARGMVRGQSLDIAAESAATPLTLERITELQRLKTGCLLEWPCRAGAMLGRAEPAPLVAYAGHLGLAFQIVDDLLDVEGSAATLGKAVGKDAGAGKATFVSILGVAGARAQAADLIAAARTALSPFGGRAAGLDALACYVLDRDR
ncbi:polyprenyl synthetase family protein [Jannaschia rubra]|uniref:polyprenyl synthetase family protein n=1 Tax=Jannaschia rubra TaxID=282197 RepID=UPI003CD0DA97